MLTSKIISTLEYYLNKLKDRKGLKVLQDSNDLYYNLNTTARLDDLQFLLNSLDIQSIFSSSILPELASSITTRLDKFALIKESAKKLLESFNLDEKDSQELCCMYARVVTNSLDYNPLYLTYAENEYKKKQQEQEELKRKNEEIEKNPLYDFIYVEGDNSIKDFYICKHQVTQKEYINIIGKNPSNFKGDNLPVEKVSWFDAIEFCNRLSEAQGLDKCYSKVNDKWQCDFSKKGYRLPTEAEWEYAANGGKKSQVYRYSGSNNIDEVAWYSKNSDGKTHPVMTKKSNELGIYDMSGNVWEWCNDERGSGRANRGGSWKSIAEHCEVSNSNWSDPSLTYFNLGFRLCLSC